MPNFIILGSLEVVKNYDTPCCIWPHFFMLKFNIIISKNGMLAKTWWQNIVFWTNAVYFVSQQIFRAECGYCFKYWTNFLDFHQFFCIRVLNLSMKNLSIATTYLVSFHNWFLGGKGGGALEAPPPLSSQPQNLEPFTCRLKQEVLVLYNKNTQWASMWTKPKIQNSH